MEEGGPLFLGPMAGNEKSEAFGDLSSLKAGAVLHIVSTMPHTTPGTVEALSKCTELDRSTQDQPNPADGRQQFGGWPWSISPKLELLVPGQY